MIARTTLRVLIATLALLAVVAGGSTVTLHSYRGDAVGSNAPAASARTLPAGAGAAETASRQCLSVGYGSPWDWSRLSASDLDRTMSTAARSGGGMVRLGVEWNTIERERGRYDWSSTDRMVDAARAHGLEVVGLLYTTPAWARDSRGEPGSLMNPPADPEDFARFAAAAATRYGDRVGTWEVWNEPNIRDFWRTGADPVAYTRMLVATYRRIKEVRPQAVVVSGGLAPSESHPGFLAPTSFLSVMYSAGAGGSFDGYGVHPYSYPGVPMDDSTPWNPWSQMQDARRLMIRNGDGAKGVWVTEFGAPTGTAQKAVSPADQARIDSEGIDAAADLPWVRAFLVYTVRDNGTDPASVEDNFGVVRRDWTPKPAAGAIAAAAARHSCAR